MNWNDRLQLIAMDIERKSSPQAVVGAYLRAMRLDEVCTNADYAALHRACQSGLDRLREERAARFKKHERGVFVAGKGA